MSEHVTRRDWSELKVTAMVGPEDTPLGVANLITRATHELRSDVIDVLTDDPGFYVVELIANVRRER